MALGALYGSGWGPGAHSAGDGTANAWLVPLLQTPAYPPAFCLCLGFMRTGAWHVGPRPAFHSRVMGSGHLRKGNGVELQDEELWEDTERTSQP